MLNEKDIQDYKGDGWDQPSITKNGTLPIEKNKMHTNVNTCGTIPTLRNENEGKRLTSIIAGSCYEHEEDYLGGQGNNHFRGFLMLHAVDNGQFDLMTVSLDYLNKKYA